MTTSLDIVAAAASGPVARPLWPVIAAMYARERQGQVRILVPDYDALTNVARFLARYFPDRRVISVPGWDIGIFDHTIPDPRIVAALAVAGQAMADNAWDIMVADAAALVSPIPVWPAAACRELRREQEFDEQDLVTRGYRRVPEVSAPGEFLVRGEIVDLWSPLEHRPVRIDRFDAWIDDMRQFDPVSQIGSRPIDSYRLAPAGYNYLDVDQQERLAEAIKGRARRTTADPEQVEKLTDALRRDATFPAISFWRVKVRTCLSLPTAWDIAVSPDNIRRELVNLQAALELERRSLGGEGIPMPHVEAVELPKQVAYAVDAAGPGYRDFGITSLAAKPARDPREQLASLLPEVNQAWEIWATADGEDSAGAKALFRDLGWDVVDSEAQLRKSSGRVALFVPQRIRGHWALPPLKLRILDIGSFLRRRAAQQLGRRRGLDLGDVKEGDYVVHEDYGIGQFVALERIQVDGIAVDIVRLKYSADDIVLVPVAKLGLISPYRGSAEEEPTLDRLGSDIWVKRKAKVKEELLRFAGELLELYAARERVARDPLPPPGEIAVAVETSFPFEETPGQLQTLEEIAKDLEASTPMDRLVVGDVGYGKTEVALRTAVRFAEAGLQVAVLVPTTVLAVQHGKTFHERLKDFALRIGVLSRFTPESEKDQIIANLRNGDLDIVIGTHRLLQPDISFKQLGLLVIDEEHRFGVKHKEALKSLRREVDTLSMSATPIPRTLQMHIGGFRPLSMIATPPPSRLGVETHVMTYDDDTVREALLRERARGGQAFYLLNKIEALEATQAHLQKLIPDLRIGIAHGKMRANDIEEVFLQFADHRIDVMLATTLIESGLDFPRANTLIVHDAQNHGLADLYQLRGRVGRSDRRAFAYLLHPGDEKLSDKAEKRLEVLRSFSNLGAGFNVAMRDLEIRGAGDLLGKRQAGNIKAIGLNAMFRLLEEAIAETQGSEAHVHIDPDIKADFSLTLSDAWLPDVEMRLRTYQRIARAETEYDIETVIAEVEDRYGHMHDDDKVYIQTMRLRPLLIALHVKTIQIQPHHAVLFVDATTPIEPLRLVELTKQHRDIEMLPDRIKICISGEPMERIATLAHWLKVLLDRATGQ